MTVVPGPRIVRIPHSTPLHAEPHVDADTTSGDIIHTLTVRLEANGVRLGEWDRRLLTCLAVWGPATAVTVAPLILRALHATPPLPEPVTSYRMNP